MKCFAQQTVFFRSVALHWQVLKTLYIHFHHGCEVIKRNLHLHYMRLPKATHDKLVLPWTDDRMMTLSTKTDTCDIFAYIEHLSMRVLMILKPLLYIDLNLYEAHLCPLRSIEDLLFCKVWHTQYVHMHSTWCSLSLPLSLFFCLSFFVIFLFS